MPPCVTSLIRPQSQMRGDAGNQHKFRNWSQGENKKRVVSCCGVGEGVEASGDINK